VFYLRFAFLNFCRSHSLYARLGEAAAHAECFARWKRVPATATYVVCRALYMNLSAYMNEQRTRWRICKSRMKASVLGSTAVMT
jgi:hypothetical protein